MTRRVAAPPTLICGPCGETIPPGASAIFGIEVGGQLRFGWTCCHRPVGDVAVVLGSRYCADQWLEAHPQHRIAVEALYRHAHNNRRSTQ